MAAPADPSPLQRVNRIPLAAQATFSIAFGIYTQIDAVRAERSWAVAGVRHVVVPTGLVTVPAKARSATTAAPAEED